MSLPRGPGVPQYRSDLGEPLLVAAMLFQIGNGLYLAWRWSLAPQSFHRTYQVASGTYLSLFILGHMSSVFIYARSFLGIPTDWNFAIGAPTGSSSATNTARPVVRRSIRAIRHVHVPRPHAATGDQANVA